MNEKWNDPEFETSFDVKAFKDKIKDILNNVIDIAMAGASEANTSIKADYQLDLDFSLFATKVRLLSNELAKGLQASVQDHGYIGSRIIPSLGYHFARKSRSLMSSGSYHTYQAAQNQHQLLFRHAKNSLEHLPA